MAERPAIRAVAAAATPAGWVASALGQKKGTPEDAFGVNLPRLPPRRRARALLSSFVHAGGEMSGTRVSRSERPRPLQTGAAPASEGLRCSKRLNTRTGRGRASGGKHVSWRLQSCGDAQHGRRAVADSACGGRASSCSPLQCSPYSRRSRGGRMRTVARRWAGTSSRSGAGSGVARMTEATSRAGPVTVIVPLASCPSK